MAAWIKLLKAAYHLALIAFTGYEVGKNSDDDKQIVIASPRFETKVSEVPEDNSGVYILIGLVTFAIIIFALKELRKCASCKRNGNVNEFPMNALPLNQQANQGQQNAQHIIA